MAEYSNPRRLTSRSSRNLNGRRLAGGLFRVVIALVIALSSALVPVLTHPAAAAGVTGVSDASLVEFLDIGSCLDPNLGVTAGGVGLFPATASGDLSLTLPAGATPDGAYVFWNGADSSDASGDPIVTWTDPVSGASSLLPDQTYGGSLWEPVSFYGAIHYAWSFRTAVSYSGTGTYSIADVGTTPGGSFDVYNNGAGALALYRDTSLGARRIQLAHGLDLMQGTTAPSSGPGSAKLVFEYDPEPTSRTADIISIAGGVFPGDQNLLWYLTGTGPVTNTVPTSSDLYSIPGAISVGNPFVSSDGLRWDTFESTITVPANDEWVIFQLQSVPSNPADPSTAPRIEWIAQSFALPLECPDLGNQTFVDWNNNGVYDPASDEPFPNNMTVSLIGSELGYSDSTTATGGVDAGAPGDSDGGNYLFQDLPAPAIYTATVPAQTGYSPTTSLSQSRNLVYPPGDVYDVDFGFLPDPDISIIKLAGNAAGDALDGDDLFLSAPQVVTYTYNVTNTGLTYLTPVTVTDDILGQICVEPGPVAPGVGFTCQISTTVSVNTTNIGTATGTPSSSDGTPVPPGVVPVTPPQDTDDASVLLVDARITLSPLNATNEIGDSHVIQALVEQNDGTGWANAADGTTVNFTFSSNTAGAAFVGPNSCTTAAGICSITINASSPGQVAVHGSTTVTVASTPLFRETDGAGGNSGDANKTYVDARINLTPLDATNPLNAPHVITATVEQNAGSGSWTAAPDGTTVTFSFSSNTAGAFFVGGINTCTTSGGVCTVTINAASAGDVSVHGLTIFSVGGVSLQRETDGLGGNSGDANKTYADAAIQIIKTVSLNGSCPGVQSVSVAAGTSVTYCYEVTNIGITYLSAISVTDDILGSICTIAGPLAPAASQTCASSPTVINVDVINVGTATGNPTDEFGNDLPQYSDVTDNDDAEVTVLLDGAIGDLVWYDANDDGIEDVVELGIGNVTMALWNDVDGNGALDPITDTMVATTTTDADGGYIFTGLQPGDYLVEVTDDGSILTGLNSTSASGPQSQASPHAVTLGPDEIYRDADFGYVEPDTGLAVVGDTVWYDPNQNGVRDDGEAGIPAVTVQLVDAGTGVPVPGFSDTTDANGEYRIVNVPPGVYYVETVSGVPGGVTESAGAPDPTSPFAVEAGDEYLDADIGYVEPNPATIGGTVWNDTSDDGTLDGGEPGIPGVSVDLIDPATGDIIATDTTDENGDYSFPGLPAGTYEVQVSDTQNVLADYKLGPLGSSPGSDNNSQGQPYSVTVVANETNTTGDFGYVQDGPPGESGAIGNQVWYDVDADGLYEPGDGDIGIEGVTIDLLNGAGQVITSTTTGASGDYIFTSLLAGSYQVQVTDIYGILDGYVDTAFPADQSADNNNKYQPYAITLGSDELNMTADFGYTLPNAIGDFVWYDANSDGIQDVGEPGIPNVTLDLYEDTDGSGDLTLGDTLVVSTTTDADGGYIFKGLEPGVYFVDVTDLNGQLTGLTQIVGNQGQPDPTGPIVVTTGDVFKDADFGYVKEPDTPGNAVVGDTVWVDADGDGLQQPWEPGIEGVDVVLVDALTSTPVFTTTTDANGHYLFDDVPPGTYYVDAVDGTVPAGLTPSPGAPDPTTTFAVAANDQYLDADIGYLDGGGGILGVIGDLVFEDANDNGAFDAGDTPFGGVSVDLIRDVNGNDLWDDGEPIIATTTTTTTLDANNGNYLFEGVLAGDYLVHVSDTNAVLFDYAQSTLGPDNQADPYRVILGVGGVDLSADFGYVRWDNRRYTGVIGNQVWIDADSDGLFLPENGDVGQAGVTVALYRDGQLLETTTTGASGDYSFLSLPAGVYTVTVTDDFGVLDGYQVTTLGPNQGADNNNQLQPYTVNLSPDEVDLTADFGYELAVPDILIIKLAGNAADGETLYISGTTTVTYTYLITNTGNTYLSDMALVDDNGTPANPADDVAFTTTECAGLAGPLAPGAGISCTYSKSVSADETNIAVVGGNPTDDQGNDLPGVDNPVDDDDATVDVVGPAILIIKLAGNAPDGATWYISGTTTVTYTYLVTNTGDTYLSDITVVDDNGTPANPADDVSVCTVAGPIAPNGSTSCTYSKSVSADETNVATASGNPTDSGGNDLPDIDDPTDDDDADVVERTPSLLLIKLAGDAPDGGIYSITGTQQVTYTYIVTNTGDTYLSDITVVDDNGTPGNLADDFTVCTVPGPLAPNADTTCTHVKSVSADTTNIAIGTGTPTDDQGGDLPGLPPVEDDDDAEVDLVGPALTLTKLAGTAPDGGVYEINGPQLVLYTYQVQNTGDTYLSNMVIVDDSGTPGVPGDDITINSVQCPALAGPLAPAGSVTCTLSKLVSVDTVNVADASGTPSDSGGTPLGVPPVSDDDDAEVVLVSDIGDFVWHDLNDNGMQDPGEPGIGNVLVCLYGDVNSDGVYTSGLDTPVSGAGDQASPFDHCTLTDGSGIYTFPDQPGGDYVVDIDPSNFTPVGALDGYAASPPNQGGDPADDSNGDPTTFDAGVTLVSGVDDPTIDFGFVELGSLGDYVWNDADSNGLQDILESGVAGVLVCLYYDVDGNGAFTPGVDTPVTSVGGSLGMEHCLPTGSTGDYLFDDLRPDDYVVDVDASNFANGQPLFECTISDPFQGSDPLADSNGDAVNADAGWTLAAGDDYAGVDFGFDCDPTPVQLATGATYARELNGTVQVHWATTDESNILGFNILRGVYPDVRLASSINGQPIAAEGAVGLTYYRYDDLNLGADASAYLYWVEVLEADGSVSYPALPLKVVLERQRTIFIPLVAGAGQPLGLVAQQNLFLPSVTH